MARDIAVGLVLVIAGLVIAPSLALLYGLDQRSRLPGHGLGSDSASTPG